ncbi:MAG TPA: DUF2267 domain-containing protein [Acetobacteraceae bacterium]|jgi:uncharacterized protein (DUF2267 family)|nr:DUF2267 domain-containing protein [Acetobacteraceae bacterium]
MSSTSIPSFTQAAQQAQSWVNELAEDMGWDERRSYRLLRCVLHALRDWLPPAEVVDLSAQLPVLIRGIYFEGWEPQQSPVWDRSEDRFIERIEVAFGDDELDDPERAAVAVFRLIDRHVSRGEIEDVRNSMKKALRKLWLAD